MLLLRAPPASLLHSGEALQSCQKNGSGRVSLLAKLPDPFRSMLECGDGILRTAGCIPDEHRRPHVDAVFRRRGYEYGRFLTVLSDSGIVGPAATCTGECGIFFVTRKDNCQRLIFDPKDANAMCLPPWTTPLPSPCSLEASETGK